MIPFDNKTERNSYDVIISKQVDEFVITEYKNDHSSGFIANFESGIRNIIPIAKFLSIEDKERIIKKILDFLISNEDELKKNDIKEFFGGLRSFSNRLMHSLQSLIKSVDLQGIDNLLLEDLSEVIIRYGTYDFGYLTILSRLNSVISKYNVLDYIQKSLFHNDFIKDGDALSALYLEFQEDFDKTIFDKIINYIAFTMDYNKSRYIEFVYDVVEKNLIPDKYKTELESLLIKLYSTISRKDIPVEDLMDMEYKTLRLVDCLIVKYPYMKKVTGVIDWLAFNDDPNTFNDVRLKK